jgi:hypothetical protein
MQFSSASCYFNSGPDTLLGTGFSNRVTVQVQAYVKQWVKL